MSAGPKQWPSGRWTRKNRATRAPSPARGHELAQMLLAALGNRVREQGHLVLDHGHVLALHPQVAGGAGQVRVQAALAHLGLLLEMIVAVHLGHGPGQPGRVQHAVGRERVHPDHGPGQVEPLQGVLELAVRVGRGREQGRPARPEQAEHGPGIVGVGRKHSALVRAVQGLGLHGEPLYPANKGRVTARGVKGNVGNGSGHGLS